MGPFTPAWASLTSIYFPIRKDIEAPLNYLTGPQIGFKPMPPEQV